MNSKPATSLRDRKAVCALPDKPGIYAVYQEGKPIYVGKAKSIHSRVSQNHCGQGKVMTGSAFRRNVAEYLGIAKAAAIKNRSFMPQPEQVATVNEWIKGCELRCIVCNTESDALQLEKDFKREWMPPLTKL